MHKSRKRVGRSAVGQIELFAAIIVVATMIVVGSVLFLIDSGGSAYYKEKLQYVTAQGATFAASYQGADRQAATQNFVKALCATMNLHGSNLSVPTTAGTINGQPAVICQASGNFPLIPNTIFPAQITMSGSSATPDRGATPLIVSLYIYGIGNTFKDPNAMATGNIFGSNNTVITAQSNSSSSNSSGPTGSPDIYGNTTSGTGSASGFNNTNSGSGDLYGNSNNNSGSGTTFGSGNSTSDSGNTFGFNNTNNTGNNIQGSSNSWN